MSAPTIPGPDPDTRIPKFVLPPLACDAHCHIFGPAAKYPYALERPYTPPDAGVLIDADGENLHAGSAGTLIPYASFVSLPAPAALPAVLPLSEAQPETLTEEPALLKIAPPLP